MTEKKVDFKLIPLDSSGFAITAPVARPGKFHDAVKLAIEHPDQAVEVIWPDDFTAGQIMGELNRSSRATGYKIRRSFRNSLCDRGVFHIWCHEKLELETPGLPAKTYSLDKAAIVEERKQRKQESA